MPKESVEEKGSRLLAAGNVTVVTFYRVTGDSGDTYTVRRRERGWTCSCPSRIPCSHIWAVRLIAEEEKPS